MNIRASSTLDDPGGFKNKFDKLYNKSCRLRASDIRSIMFRKTDRVYNISLILKTDKMYYLKIIPDRIFPEKNPGEYMSNLELITDKLNKWNVSGRVRDILENLPDEIIKKEMTFNLGVCDTRISEFE